MNTVNMEQEIWRPIPKMNGYEASNTGLIRKDGILHKIYTHTYRSVYFKGQTFKVATLVCLAFHQQPQYSKKHRSETGRKLIANHKNGNKHDDRAVNLEWCTQKENARHAVRTGLNKGKRQNHYELTPENRKLILEMLMDGAAKSKIRTALNVSDRIIELALKQAA